MHMESGATQVHLSHGALPGSCNDLLQPGESFSSLIETNLGQAAVALSLHRSKVNSQPANKGTEFPQQLRLVSTPHCTLRISGDQHIFRLGSAGCYHNKGFRHPFMKKNPVVIILETNFYWF